MKRRKLLKLLTFSAVAVRLTPKIKAGQREEEKTTPPPWQKWDHCLSNPIDDMNETIARITKASPKALEEIAKAGIRGAHNEEKLRLHIDGESYPVNFD